MARKSGPLSWGEEAELLTLEANDEVRPEWMPSRDEIEAYLLDIRGPRVLVTGSENWTDRRSIAGSLKRALKYLDRELEDSTLIHGASRGADLTAASIAKKLDMVTESHPADRLTHSSSCSKVESPEATCWVGRSTCRHAEARRDQEMIDSGADILLVFLSEDSPEATAVLERWTEADRPAILCRQSSPDGPVEGEFLNMERWRDRD